MNLHDDVIALYAVMSLAVRFICAVICSDSELLGMTSVRCG